MFKNKFVLLMMIFTLSSLVLADQFQTRNLQTAKCCSLCSQKNNVYSPINPIKFRNQVMNASMHGLSDPSALIILLRKLHFDFTDQLYQGMKNFEYMVNLGVVTCPVDVTNTDRAPYSQFDNQTITWIEDVLELEMRTSFDLFSVNYLRTYQRLSKSIRQYLQIFLKGGFYFYSAQELKQFIYRFRMYYVTTVAFTLDHTKRKNFVDTINNAQDLCLGMMPGQNICKNFIEVSSMLQIGGDQQILTVTSQQVKQIPFFSKLNANLRSQQVSISTLSLDRYSDVDAYSIFTPDFLSLLNMVDFQGTIYVPDDQDLQTLPNNGFAPGETVSTVWAKLISTMYAPYLYCGMNSLYSKLKQTCPASCIKTC